MGVVRGSVPRPNEVYSKNGSINCYRFHRRSMGGNDDGSDSVAFIVVKDGVIVGLGIIAIPS